MNAERFNLWLGLAIGFGTVTLITFVFALIGAKSGEIATALATIIGGSFVLGGAILAWQSVQQQIASAEALEIDQRNNEITIIEVGFTCEILVYSTAIIESLSIWNKRAFDDPNKFLSGNFPKFTDLLYYRTNIGKIGLVREKWAVAAIIGFYTNLLELNDQTNETTAGRPVINQTSSSVANRLRIMAANIAEALDGLNNHKKFSIQAEVNFEQIFMPNGSTVNDSAIIPNNLQEVLLAISTTASH